jgi:hypothetical protein
MQENQNNSETKIGLWPRRADYGEDSKVGFEDHRSEIMIGKNRPSAAIETFARSRDILQR